MQNYSQTQHSGVSRFKYTPGWRGSECNGVPESDGKSCVSAAEFGSRTAEGGCDTPPIGRFVVCKVGQK